MSNQLEDRIIGIVQGTLRLEDPELTIGAEDTMDTIVGWDSLQFMNVFMAVNDAFDLDPDFDDAIHYTAISTLVAYIGEQTA